MNENLAYPVLFPSNEYSRNLSKKYGYKEWMISRFLKFIPSPEKLLEHVDNNKNSHIFIRINTIKIDPQTLKERLKKKGFQLNKTILTEVYEIRNQDRHCINSNISNNGISKSSDDGERSISDHDVQNDEKPTTRTTSIGSTLEYLKGYYYIQDLSSCIAVEELEIQGPSEMVVLDMAASPGGKTTHIAQKLNNHGTIIACESNPKRLSSLIFNLSRCFVKNTLIYNMKGEEIQKLDLKFDRVLLDAPCTCEGIVLKDDSRKKSRNLKDLATCSEKQKKMIVAGFNVLKQNGLMVYSTCSFAPEENEMVIQYLIDTHKNAIIEPLKYGTSGLTQFYKYKFTEKMIETKRFYPHIHDTNGFFIAKIRKKEV